MKFNGKSKKGRTYKGIPKMSKTDQLIRMANRKQRVSDFMVKGTRTMINSLNMMTKPAKDFPPKKGRTRKKR